MQSRYVLAVCALALLVAVVSAQQPGQQQPQPPNPLETLLGKLREEAENLISESIDDINAAVECVKEARQACQDQLKSPLDLIKYVSCAIDYLRANQNRCKQASEQQ